VGFVLVIPHLVNRRASVVGDVEDSRELVAAARRHGVTLAPGNYFRPNMEVSPWVRVNTAYTGEARAMAFLQEAGRRPARKRA
jgi:DNA-binding transcriptional MocR family regulator